MKNAWNNGKSVNRAQVGASIVLVFTALASLTARADQQCPSEIRLEQARFLGGQKFPTREQIARGFDQSITAPPRLPVWSIDDLNAATEFVSVLQKRYNEIGP